MNEIDEALIRRIKETVIRVLDEQNNLISIGVSNRHIHVSKQDFRTLYGPDKELVKIKDLIQPGQFAAKEMLTIIGPKGKIEGVRILGPFREKTQVEISQTDEYLLGIKAPIRESGDLSGTSGIKLQGPYGELNLEEGTIIASRHIHLDNETAKRMNIQNGQEVKVKAEGKRALVFESVIARVSSNYLPEIHIDTDEANAAGLKTGDRVRITK